MGYMTTQWALWPWNALKQLLCSQEEEAGSWGAWRSGDTGSGLLSLRCPRVGEKGPGRSP